jgi:aryl-phospho-beta-D-glucosidase BglC (GH1 family)
MKQLGVALLLVVGVSVGSPGCAQPGELFHTAYPHAFVDAAGHPVRMNGLNIKDVGAEGWVQPQERWNQMQAKGFNVVRLAMRWPDYEPSRGSYTNLAALDTAVARAKAAGLYVILDPIHATRTEHYPAWATAGGGDELTVVAREALPYLRTIAARYKNEPTVIAIDAANELRQSNLDSRRLLATYDTLIGAIRAEDPDKIVIVEPQSGNQDPRLMDFSALTQRSNVVWSPHFYFAGGEADGYSAAGWASAGNYVWDGVSDYPTPNQAQLDAHVAAHVDAMETVRLPILIGEYGIGDGVTNHDQWIRDNVAVFDRYGLDRVWWLYAWSTMAAVDSNYNWRPWVDLLT